MIWLCHLAHFFGGLFLVNVIPHMAAGTMGRAFQSPFANPRGVGLSSSTVNVLWAWFNLAIAYLLLFQCGDFDVHSFADVAPPALAGLLISLQLAKHFGALHGGNLKKKT